MIRKLISSACLFLLIAGRFALAQDATTHTKDSLEAVKENVKSGKAVIVDVREQNEWDAGHLKGAILTPLSKLKNEGQVMEMLKLLPKDKIVYTHCRAGGRALTCGDILKAHGYDVRPLKPGFEDLVKAGFEKAEGKP
jgi:rhodanese-related sulfurtransferase